MSMWLRPILVSITGIKRHGVFYRCCIYLLLIVLIRDMSNDVVRYMCIARREFVQSNADMFKSLAELFVSIDGRSA